MSAMRILALVLIAGTALYAGSVRAQSATLPSTGTIAVTTYESAGLYWQSPGGTAGCEVKYRKQGETAWKEAMPMWYDARDTQCRGSIVGQPLEARDRWCRRAAGAALVIGQDGIALHRQEPRPEGERLASERTGTMDEDERRMGFSAAGKEQRARQVAVRHPHRKGCGADAERPPRTRGAALDLDDRPRLS